MKAILVIDMPTNCRGCDKLVRKGCLKGDYRKDERPKQCPLKPLPKGHGRLKDIDKVEQLLDLGKPDNVIAKALKNIMESVPTIIEADKGEE